MEEGNRSQVRPQNPAVLIDLLGPGQPLTRSRTGDAGFDVNVTSDFVSLLTVGNGIDIRFDFGRHKIMSWDIGCELRAATQAIRNRLQGARWASNCIILRMITDFSNGRSRRIQNARVAAFASSQRWWDHRGKIVSAAANQMRRFGPVPSRESRFLEVEIVFHPQAQLLQVAPARIVGEAKLVPVIEDNLRIQDFRLLFFRQFLVSGRHKGRRDLG